MKFFITFRARMVYYGMCNGSIGISHSTMDTMENMETNVSAFFRRREFGLYDC